MGVYEPKSETLYERILELYWHEIEDLKKRKKSHPRWDYNVIETRIKTLFSIMPPDMRKKEIYSKINEHECIWCDRRRHKSTHLPSEYRRSETPMDAYEVISYFSDVDG